MEALIAKYGVFKLSCIAAVVLLVLFYGSILSIAKFKGWYYEGKSERLEEKLDTAKAEAKAARKDENQVTKSGQITANTAKAQDKHAAAQREETNKTVDIINERIIKVPVVVPVLDDPIVRLAVSQARARAQAAIGRLQGTQATGQPER